ncbi:MAG: hypothetical protein ACE5GM_08075 [bacterium]
MKRSLKTVFALFLFLAIALPVSAVEVAPRISDREIIESLTQLRAEHKAIKSEINVRFDSVNERFDSVNERFDSVNKRIDDLRFDINTRLNAIIGIVTIVLGFLIRMQWQMNKRQIQTETSLETQKDEIAWLKEMVNKLLPPRGVL